MRQGQPQVNLTLTPMVKALIIINVTIWVVFQLLLEGYGGVKFSYYLGLYPGKFIYEYAIWQPLTYMFLHSLQVSHILFNMLTLWFVGVELEQRWGKKFFLWYYLITGVGAALIYCFVMAIYSAITGSQQGLVVPVVGASGAIFGLLLAYGIIFGERQMYFMMVFPMKAKYFVLVLGAIEVVSILTSGVTGGEVAYLAHLGGLISGYLTLLGWTRIQQSQWRKAQKKKGGGRLRLVVDNDATKDQNKGSGKGHDNDPKYWN